MLIAGHQLIGGGEAEVRPREISFRFNRPRTVLSTSEYNGGIKKLHGAFNQELHAGISSPSDLPGGAVAEYFRLRAE